MSKRIPGRWLRRVLLFAGTLAAFNAMAELPFPFSLMGQFLVIIIWLFAVLLDKDTRP